MMRKSHSLKHHNRSLSETEKISGAIVFFISLGLRCVLLSGKMRSLLWCCRWGGGIPASTIKVRWTRRCIMQKPRRVCTCWWFALCGMRRAAENGLYRHTPAIRVLYCLFVWAVHLTRTLFRSAGLKQASLWQELRLELELSVWRQRSWSSVLLLYWFSTCWTRTSHRRTPKEEPQPYLHIQNFTA